MKSHLMTYSEEVFRLAQELQETKTTTRIKVFGHMGYAWDSGENIPIEYIVIDDEKKKNVCTIKIFVPGGKPGVLYPIERLPINTVVLSSVEKAYEGLYSTPCDVPLDTGYGFGRLYFKKPHIRVKEQWGFCTTCYRHQRYKEQVINLHKEPYAYQQIYEDINEYAYGHYVSPIGKIVYHQRLKCLMPPLRFPSITASEHHF